MCSYIKSYIFAVLFKVVHLNTIIAGVVKLVDTLDLGSSASRCVGSSPSTRTLFSGYKPDVF